MEEIEEIWLENPVAISKDSNAFYEDIMELCRAIFDNFSPEGCFSALKLLSILLDVPDNDKKHLVLSMQKLSEQYKK